MSSYIALSDEQKQYISDLNIGSSVRLLMDSFGYSPDQAIEMSLKNKEERRQRWLTGVIDKLAEKHGTNRQAVLSVLFDDNRGDITTSDAYKRVECHDFASKTLHELKHPVSMDVDDNLPVPRIEVFQQYVLNGGFATKKSLLWYGHVVGVDGKIRSFNSSGWHGHPDRELADSHAAYWNRFTGWPVIDRGQDLLSDDDRKEIDYQGLQMQI